MPILSNREVTDKLKKKAASIALGFLLLYQPAIAQEHRAFTVPFHTVNGMILLDATVNGKPAVLVLDTGTKFTLTTQAVKHERASILVAGLTFEKQHVLTVNLDSLSKWAGTRIDGLLGQDILREFSAVRIDYKRSVVEFDLRACPSNSKRYLARLFVLTVPANLLGEVASSVNNREAEEAVNNPNSASIL